MASPGTPPESVTTAYGRWCQRIVITAGDRRWLSRLHPVFAAWLPIRRAQVHRTHGQVIGQRAEADRAALTPLPPMPYLVADLHLRRVGKDCLVSFEASLYSVPAVRVRAGQYVQLRVTPQVVAIHALPGAGGQLLTAHPRAARRGSWVTDPAHWDGLPDGHSRAVTRYMPPAPSAAGQPAGAGQLAALLAGHGAAATPVARAERATLGYLDFLDLALGEEVGLKDSRRAWTYAQFPQVDGLAANRLSAPTQHRNRHLPRSLRRRNGSHPRQRPTRVRRVAWQ